MAVLQNHLQCNQPLLCKTMRLHIPCARNMKIAVVSIQYISHFYHADTPLLICRTNLFGLIPTGIRLHAMRTLLEIQGLALRRFREAWLPKASQ